MKLIVDPSGPALDLHVPLSIIIGTIPLHSIARQYQTQYGVSGPPELPPTGPAPSTPPIDRSLRAYFILSISPCPSNCSIDPVASTRFSRRRRHKKLLRGEKLYALIKNIFMRQEYCISLLRFTLIE